MTVQNTERAFLRVLRAAAERSGVAVETIGMGWIVRFSRGDMVRFAYGYSLDLNAAATHQIACDKAATSEVLLAAGIKHVPHHLFLHPGMAKYAPHRGNWSEMLALCERLKWDVVVKDNAGTGGRGVLRVRTPLELEQAVYTLFDRCTSIAISPFVEANTEIRFVMLGGECELAFTKMRPSVIGDGRRTAFELLGDQIAREGWNSDRRRLIENLEADTLQGLTVVPPAGSIFLLNWRHNLGQGASASLINPDDHRLALEIAIRTAAAMNLRFGSIDMLITPDGPSVLEVNAGVMMEYVSRSIPGGEQMTERVYTKAFEMAFGTA
jgi:D-alanine-D-alanine ligase-like ATP-grasp enzyme